MKACEFNKLEMNTSEGMSYKHWNLCFPFSKQFEITIIAQSVSVEKEAMIR